MTSCAECLLHWLLARMHLDIHRGVCRYLVEWLRDESCSAKVQVANTRL